MPSRTRSQTRTSLPQNVIKSGRSLTKSKSHSKLSGIGKHKTDTEQLTKDQTRKRENAGEKSLKDWIEQELGYPCSKFAKHLANGHMYVPPRSPHKLMQELLFCDPWKMSVVCMLLNQTTARNTKKVLYPFFKKFPSPVHVIDHTKKHGREKTHQIITDMIFQLGLHKKRADYIIEMSKQWLEEDWEYPDELMGLGKYASDSYKMFCSGEWKDVQPTDKYLKVYHRYLSNREQARKAGAIVNVTVDINHIPSNAITKDLVIQHNNGKKMTGAEYVFLDDDVIWAPYMEVKGNKPPQEIAFWKSALERYERFREKFISMRKYKHKSRFR